MLQRDDAQSQLQQAQTQLQQGEILKQLTILNMLYLPPSFVAVSASAFLSD